ncbi:hypothetical protein EK0264_01290 [Epidermidibacterium keratini]|uniref:Uncharacterized protein n=1 Tax=Epidermidibacterium keratini TaxID=1891644 RepID=A0A7L4YIL0_9ACTN|nr:hypothetical protein [Epidermidibacterium keratini]QHB99069.1 hypothetical protein EK0264_01290 [Epidermidibacterium keratini]
MQPHPAGAAPLPPPGALATSSTPPRTLDPDRPSVLTRAVTSLWRLAIAIIALYAVYLTVSDNGVDSLYNLSQLSALIAGVYFGVLAIYAWIPRRRVDEPSPVVRLWIVILTSITCGVYFARMSGDVSGFESLAVHLVVPLMVIVDWCLFGRNQEDMAGWHPFIGLVAPLAYLGVALWRGSDTGTPLYYFLDPGRSDFFMFLGVMIIAVVLFGYLLLVLGLIHRVARTGVGRGRRQSAYDPEYDARYRTRR